MANNDKITRDSVLYMQPEEGSYGNPDDFASCGTCYSWMGKQRERCYILGKRLEVKAEHSCGIYVNGKPEIERAGNEKELVSPEEAGFIKDRVQCKRCYWYSTGLCGLFAKLNMKDPDHFDMDPVVSANGCCDAWTPQDAKFEHEGFFEILNKKIDFKKIFK